MCTYTPKKSFSSLADENYFGQKRFLSPDRKVFFTLLSVEMCPFIYAKKITAPKLKIEKMKIEYFFGRNLFFTPL
jgi:hypothetical protein